MSALSRRSVRAFHFLLSIVVLATFAPGCGHQRGRPGSSAVTATAPVEDRLGVDDVFEIRIFNEPDLGGNYRVSAEGTIDFPLVGRLKVAGLRAEELQELLVTKLKAGYLKDPQLSILIKSWNSRKVSVLGQVSRPGAVEYFPRMTIVDAIALAGGFTAIADKNTVNLRREVAGKVETKVYPVADISEGRSPNVPVLPGDVVVVEERLF